MREIYFTKVADKQDNSELLLFETTGFSMWPFIKPEEKLIVKKVPAESLAVGDIILYRGGNQLVCHRLIKKVKAESEYLLYTRGDNSVFLPKFITEQMFIGKVTGILRNGKIIGLHGLSSRLINRLIVMIGPLGNATFKMLKPLFNCFKSKSGTFPKVPGY